MLLDKEICASHGFFIGIREISCTFHMMVSIRGESSLTYLGQIFSFGALSPS